MGNKIAVIKLGGHAMDKADLFEAFLDDIAALANKGMGLVIVHGGGPHINGLLKRLGVESSFVNGLRVTDSPIMEAVEMALCGKVNKQVTRSLEKHGIKACGISGQDGGLLAASVKDPALGRVGKIDTVNAEILRTLLAGEYLPVVAPVALDKNCDPLNVNADTAAGAIAGALNADYFVLLSDVPGVLNENGGLEPALTPEEILRMREAGVISGGMIPKVECCEMALIEGAENALILDGRQPNSLRRYIENNEALGTVIRMD